MHFALQELHDMSRGLFVDKLHVLLQELQDAVGTTVGAGVNLTGQLTRAAVPVAQGIVGAVREVVEVETC